MTDTTQWRCLNCRQLRKHSATYCCNQPWQNVIDRSYIDQSKQGQGQTDPYAHDWRQDQPWGQQWRSNSPRQRVQSPRHRKGKKQNGNSPRGQSRGRGHGPPSSDQQPGKGKGKGDFPQVPQAPLPPPPMPWPGYMPMGQNMPVMMRQMAQMQPMQIAPASTTTTSAIDAASANASSYHDSRAASQRAENAGVDGLLEAPWTRPSTGCFPKSPRVLQEGWSTSKEGSANSRKSLGRSQRHLRSSSPGTYEPDIIMEHFPDRCGSYMARVRPPVFKVWKPSIRRGFKLLEKSSLWQVDEAKSALGEAIEVNDVDDEEDLAGPSNVATSEKITESMQFLTASLHQFQQREQKKYMWKFSHHSNAPD